MKAGKTTESAVLNALLQGFEGNKSQGVKDGIVTLDEWVAYYEELSASIDSDTYFAEMVAGAWKGLEGKFDPPVPKAEVGRSMHAYRTGFPKMAGG